MMLVLVLTLIAVVATDVAVGILYVTVRRQSVTQTAGIDAALTDEIDELVGGVRARAEQAGLEIARQKAQLRRMLDDLDDAPVTRRVASKASRTEPQAIPTRQEILHLASEGHSLRAIAGRTGISLEEARLMLAAGDPSLASA